MNDGGEGNVVRKRRTFCVCMHYAKVNGEQFTVTDQQQNRGKKASAASERISLSHPPSNHRPHATCSAEKSEKEPQSVRREAPIQPADSWVLTTDDGSHFSLFLVFHSDFSLPPFSLFFPLPASLSISLLPLPPTTSSLCPPLSSS